MIETTIFSVDVEHRNKNCFKRRGENEVQHKPNNIVQHKILEHIIHSHIMKHLVEYGILVDFQHGFRAKRSTETQLLLATVHDISGVCPPMRNFCFCDESVKLTLKTLV